VRTLLLIVMVVTSSFAQACFVPRGGPDFDRLVFIEKLPQLNTYRVTVPRHLENELREAEIILAYSKDHAGGIPIYDPFQILHATATNEKRSAVFQVERREGLRPYIVVMWWNKVDGLCGVQANTGFLQVE
jgi:hypothetical protein